MAYGYTDFRARQISFVPLHLSAALFLVFRLSSLTSRKVQQEGEEVHLQGSHPPGVMPRDPLPLDGPLSHPSRLCPQIQQTSAGREVDPQARSKQGAQPTAGVTGQGVLLNQSSPLCHQTQQMSWAQGAALQEVRLIVGVMQTWRNSATICC